jgi:hypothetical protein
MRCRKPTATRRAIGNDERIRIPEALNAVQESLNNYRAQISTESSAVPEKYETLVRDTRRVAGDMHEAWKAPPLDNDAGMNIAHVDDHALGEPQKRYPAAVKADLGFWRVAFPWLRSW